MANSTLIAVFCQGERVTGPGPKAVRVGLWELRARHGALAYTSREPRSICGAPG